MQNGKQSPRALVADRAHPPANRAREDHADHGSSPQASRELASAQRVRRKRARGKRVPSKRVSRKSARQKRRAAQQIELPFRSWGGARKGAGRKRKSGRPLVPHGVRLAHKARFPVLITSRLMPGLPSLRRAAEAECVLRAIDNSTRPPAVLRNPGASLGRGSASPRFQIVHHSIQSNHIHLIVEAQDRRALTSGVRGFVIRLARALNRLWSRRGAVFADRFHERELSNPRQVRHALVYVLNNSRKHGLRHAGPDPLSSAPRFDGWLTDEDERWRETRSAGAGWGEAGSGMAGPGGAGSGGARSARAGSAGAAPARQASAAPSAPRATRFGGFAARLPVTAAARAGHPRATTWLLGQGWKRHGLIDLFESPRGA